MMSNDVISKLRLATSPVLPMPLGFHVYFDMVMTSYGECLKMVIHF